MRAESDYRRSLAEAALFRIGRESTAAEVLEAMASLAHGEGHPSRLWKSFSVLQVASALKRLTDDGIAAHGADRTNSKRARPDQTWVATTKASGEIPRAPEADEPVPVPLHVPVVPTTAPVESYSPSQLRVLLAIGDDMFGLVARFARDLQDHNDRARRRLEEVGLL